MNTPTTLTACLVAAAATSAGITYLLQPQPVAATEQAALTPDAWRDLSGTLERIQAEQERLSDALNELQMAPAGETARLPVGEIEKTVARLLAERDLIEEPEELVEAPVLESLGSNEDLMAQLEEIGFQSRAGQELWQRIREAGRTQELLALFEGRVEDDPNDPEKRLELGQAYLQMIQEVGQSPLAGEYATKADSAFDAALEIDPEHWDARFNKAIALSFWPPIFGKQSESIRQFELLIDQQSKLTPSSEHADTHLWLGNLYQQLGQQDKAIAAWRTGSSLFPDHAGLNDQLRLIGGQ